MFIQNRIQNAAVSIVSASLAANSVTDWFIYEGFNTSSFNGSENTPMVQIVCDKWEPMYPQNNLGIGKCVLHIGTFAEKTITTAGEFETVSDIVFNPFLANNIISTMSLLQPSLTIKGLYDVGLNVETVKDGWLASQDIEIVVGRIS